MQCAFVSVCVYIYKKIVPGSIRSLDVSPEAVVNGKEGRRVLLKEVVHLVLTMQMKLPTSLEQFRVIGHVREILS